MYFWHYSIEDLCSFFNDSCDTYSTEPRQKLQQEESRVFVKET